MKAAIFQSDGAYKTFDERLLGLREVIYKGSFDLLVCPELFASGYNVGEDLRELAQLPDGRYYSALSNLAQEYACSIVYGYPESSANGTIYNSAACIDKRGQLIANHRKLIIPPGFESSYFETGKGLTLFDLNGFRCALLICYDAEYPESVRAVAQAGAQVVIVPTALAANWGSVAKQMMPTRAFENGVWLLYANHAGEEHGISYFGGSCIVSPSGEEVSADAAEQVIAAQIDAEAVTVAQQRLPYLDGANKLSRRLV